MAFIVGGRPCVHGFDWSYYQAPRDLRSAFAEGNRFCVIKASEGESYRDPKYAQHVANASVAGLTVGAYHFARPDWSDGSPAADGRQEARVFLGAIDPRIEFVVLDLEATALNAQETTDYVLGFWGEVIASGMYPRREQRVTYVGKWFTYVHAGSIRDASCLWIPAYTAPGNQPNPDPTRIPLPAWSIDLWPEGWCIWQYTSGATVAGLHPSDANVATTAWLDAVTSKTPHPMEHLMFRPISVKGQPGLWQITIDGNGNYRRTDLRSPGFIDVLARAGYLTLEDGVELDGDQGADFLSIPVANPRPADEGALTLAINIMARVDQKTAEILTALDGIEAPDVDEAAIAAEIREFLAEDTLAPAIARELIEAAYAGTTSPPK